MHRWLLILPLWLAACGRAPEPTSPPPAAPAAATPAPVPAAPPLTFPARFEHADLAKTEAGQRRSVLFLTDNGEHGWMQHENTAGAILLGKRLAAALPGCAVTVYRDQFPTAEELAAASSVVLFTSGTDRHLLNNPDHLAALNGAMKAGKGLAALHWALEAGTPEGTAFLKEHLGGFFEVNFSVNPMWLAEFKTVTPHEATQGVSPYSIYDEFYFNMRLPEVPGTRIALLEAIPPKKVVLMPEDGPRSNNPHVRASHGKPHVIGWVYERPGGGRSFGFTGGHFHWDWKQDDQRRLALNAIAWTAGFTVPEGGVPDQAPTDAELLEHQDSPPVPGWKPMPGQPGMEAPAPPPKA